VEASGETEEMGSEAGEGKKGGKRTRSMERREELGLILHSFSHLLDIERKGERESSLKWVGRASDRPSGPWEEEKEVEKKLSWIDFLPPSSRSPNWVGILGG